MTDLSRGALALFAERGDCTSKPRPGVIVQHPATLSASASITLCGLTTHRVPPNEARVVVMPSEENGLHEVSFVMVDKIASINRTRIRSVIGTLDDMTMRQVDQALRRWLAL